MLQRLIFAMFFALGAVVAGLNSEATEYDRGKLVITISRL
jgi:hypothetical protein